MAPQFQAVVHATQAWLRSSWHIQVPFAWLEACVEWLQEEAGGASHLSQQQINQQALDQWLLADLRDLDYPVLPEGLAQAQKTELNGTFCVQVDSFLDISQPAYGQLQKLRCTDCENDEVSAVTQATQRPWEAKPTRMLLLQVTDGVQSLEAMEYQSIPALSTALRPGVKLQLQGQMVCRLGMLLLGPSNVKVLGGEVEDLVDRNKQERVLCRTLGVPEEEQQQQQAGEEDPPAPQQGNHDVDDLELDDAELVASLDAQEVVERIGDEPAEDSAYGTRSEPSTQSSRSSSIRSLVSAAPARRGLTQSNNRDGSVQGHRHSYEQENCNVLPSVLLSEQEIQDQHMEDEDFPDEDFDNLPLDELDAAIFQETTNGADIGHNSAPNESTALKPRRATIPLTAQFEQNSGTASGSWISSRNCRSSTQKTDYEGFSTGVTGQLAAGTYPMDFAANAEMDFVDEDMDCLLINEQTGESNQLPAQQGLHTDRQCITKKTEISSSSCAITSKSSRSASYTTSTPGFNRPAANTRPQSQSSVPALTLTSPPFTYLCLLEQMASSPDFQTTEIHLKAFIVTLLGKLSSSNNLWRVTATISDGTGYLDVELSNDVLTSLLGFSVAEKGVLKRDSARRRELDAGMKRCQEELVDMCCIMTIVVEAEGRKAVVTKAEAISEEVLQELEQRVKAVRK